LAGVAGKGKGLDIAKEKGVSTMDAWIGIIAILVGLVSCFYGYPLFRILLILAGLLGGYIFGQYLLQTGNPWLSLGVGVVSAVIMAVLAYPLWSVGFTIAGALLGFAILGEIGIALNASKGVIILLGIIGAVIIGVLFYHLKDFFVILTTAIKGAAEVAFGLCWIIPGLSFRPGEASWVTVAIIVLLGAAGSAVQYGMFKGRRTYSETPPAKRRNSPSG
jgi:hypothetical protein